MSKPKHAASVSHVEVTIIHALRSCSISTIMSIVIPAEPNRRTHPRRQNLVRVPL